jgi:hypothetical protein
MGNASHSESEININARRGRMIINKMDDMNPTNKSSNTRRMNRIKQVQAESMLGQMKVCIGIKDKRELVKRYNPHHYIFGIKLDPRNPYEENGDELRDAGIDR